jgi:hypothetical protein
MEYNKWTSCNPELHTFEKENCCKTIAPQKQEHTRDKKKDGEPDCGTFTQSTCVMNQINQTLK